MEENVGREIGEKEPRKRNVVLYFIRHGKAGYTGREDAEGFLTDDGKTQAQGAARNLYNDLPSEAVIEFVSSNRTRSLQTTQEIKNELQSLIAQEDNKKITIHDEARDVKTFQRLGMTDKLTQEALRWRDPVAAWLEDEAKIVDQTTNEDEAKDIDKAKVLVSEMKGNFGSMLRHIDRFSRQVSPGPDLYIVGVVHTGPSEVFIGKLLGNIPEGRLENCEAFKISMLSNGQTELTFKGETDEINI